MLVRLWGSVFAYGVTVRTAGNRFTEIFGTVHYSLWSMGLLTSATDNQATHCVYTDGARQVNRGNQILNPEFCEEQHE